MASVASRQYKFSGLLVLPALDDWLGQVFAPNSLAAAIDVGGDIEEITQWINAAKADRLQAEAALQEIAAPAACLRT
jgi:hypothetical protein